MAEFRLVKKISLSFLGEGWEEAYANFRRPLVTEVKDMDKRIKSIDKETDSALDLIIEAVNKYFVDGKGISTEGKLVDLEVDKMPIDFFYESYSELLGGSQVPKS